MEQEYLKYLPDGDIYLYNTGEAQNAYTFFGCHYIEEIDMYRFCLWAPNAQDISIVGDFNGWTPGETPMERYKNGVWVCFVKGLHQGDNYKYQILGYDGNTVLKADPFAFHSEVRPQTASKVWSLGGYEWHDDRYIQQRIKKNVLKSPISIYELHIGSWRTKEGYSFPSFREVADELAEYLVSMGYTHVELMPVAEFPFDGSWGYQVTGFYAITSRYGTPQDFMYFVDKMHQNGIGVIVDWVPGHFPKDSQGLPKFDGTHLYEHENKLQREHPQWGTLLFNYGRPEVVSFFVSNAVYFMDVYHADGLRIDAVTSILYLDYARDGVFVPYKDGGNIDGDAVQMLRKVNSVVLTKYAGTMTIAEESTAYPMVTMPPSVGGLGFTFKWNMGFMHDTLKYMSMDPYFRKDHHDKLTFSMMYAFSENYILAYSHDEVVHGKKSMIDKMYGDYAQKFASLRTLYGYMFAHPGKKLMFMGDEFAQFIEWDYKKQLDWFLLDYDSHAGMQRFVKKLNHIYTENKPLHEIDNSWEGFQWLNVNDSNNSILAFMRNTRDEHIICVFNFTPVYRENYWVAVPYPGELELLVSSDDPDYAGWGTQVIQKTETQNEPVNDFKYSVSLTLPSLSALYYRFTKTETETEDLRIKDKTEDKKDD